ncbi:hypothetical protein LTR48_002868 [Friedmanniomyces endolithicus]|uniref:Uncharacterized protein n=1 Tax=Rachicladosporium monterosium TaxID=1507873 RepID=A0ABR0L9S1_9PEZI|nr:hypothetical protein LTR48_002868 [Friedmanniomyces endolithicus]KAK5145601.1 hypothetical protein LTR32_002674 [Rachicladosporium monterosium]
MKLPYLPRSDLHIARPQHRTLDALVDNGKKAMHLMSKTLVERATTSSSAASSSTCEPGNTAAICAKPTDGMNTQTLPIVLGAVFIKRQRIEDDNDAHKSLDFGVDMAPSKPRRKHGDVPEMKVTDMSGAPSRPGQRGRGMSMDMSNPYLMPAGLQDSRESIHSMSRSMRDEHDPYRPVAMLRYSTESSRPRHDNASQYSASTLHSTNEKVNLLAHAQKAPRNGRSAPPSRKTSLGSTDQLIPNLGETPPPRKQSLPKSLPVPPPPPAPPIEQERRPRTTSQSASRPPRTSSASASATARKAVPVQQQNEPSYFPPVAAQPGYGIDPAMISVGRYSIDTPNPSQQYPVEQMPVSTMGRRPLPPDMPEENAELRANRIRSFYKEYFDDSRPRHAPAHYEEDYDAGYADAAIYDPETGGFAMPGQGRPFAQPVGRRAMTPPPRGAPRAPAPHHNRHYSSQSAGRPQNRGRARTGGPTPPAMPKKRAAPPKPLQGLPTPHKLKDFDSVISSPIDFAPPSTYRNYQNGSAPSSPTGKRPYSPSVRAFNPLASSYDELSVMPSPHLLRNSSTFTGLDFAPPNRLGAHNESGGGSDAGSIRSARSGISARQLDAVRAGAYRVSRIPKEMVTSREDLTAQLRPKLSMVTPG